jgi:tetratricopeptide (TPR) repeat protein
MGVFRRFLGRGRIRRSRERLAENPTPRNYASLAQELARIGNTQEVQRVCAEGLATFPGNVYLSRLASRACRLEREKRLGELKAEIREAPRPALYQEMCSILLESGDLNRGEDIACDWYEARRDNEALFYLARIHLQRFYSDRGRAAGRQALESLEASIRQMPDDPRPLHAKLELLMKVGAHRDAHATAARLLQIEPGAPALEGRFRTLVTCLDHSPTLEQAFVNVEHTGQLADESALGSEAEPMKKVAVQPLLRELVRAEDIHAALYVRGSTVLVQGPKGAEAERIARAVHKILLTSRSAGRRFGLGQVFQVQLEGDFGLLSIAPGEQDAGAIWSKGALGSDREGALLGMTGLASGAPLDVRETA